jgi:hypothetical protein
VPGEEMLILRDGNSNNYALAVSDKEEDIFVRYSLQNTAGGYELSNIAITEKRIPQTNVSGKETYSLVTDTSFNITVDNINTKIAYSLKMVYGTGTQIHVASNSAFIVPFLNHHGFKATSI